MSSSQNENSDDDNDFDYEQEWEGVSAAFFSIGLAAVLCISWGYLKYFGSQISETETYCKVLSSDQVEIKHPSWPKSETIILREKQ